MEIRFIFISVELTTPVVGAKIVSTMPPMITQDRKWGRYNSVCDTRLIPVDLISLSMIDRIMGTGKPTIRSRKFSSSVFCSAIEKSLILKTNSKFAMPTD